MSCYGGPGGDGVGLSLGVDVAEVVAGAGVDGEGDVGTRDVGTAVAGTVDGAAELHPAIRRPQTASAAMARIGSQSRPDKVRIARARADMSSSACPPAISPVSSCAAGALRGRTAPTRAGRSSAMARSLRWSATLNPSG